MTDELARYLPRFDLAGWHLLRRVLAYRRSLPHPSPRLVDLGMGRGRDAIYLARHGFRVLGVDRSPVLVERARRRAARLGVPLELRTSDLRTVRWRGHVDVVYASCALNYHPRGIRARRFAAFQAATAAGGIHAVNAFGEGALRAAGPEVDAEETAYRPGELRRYYEGWSVLESGILRFECRARAAPHRHAIEYLVARKP